MFQRRTPVAFPSFRISRTQIQNGCPVSVYPYGPCHQPRGISLPYFVDLYIERIKFSLQVFGYPGIPHPVFGRFHVNHAIHGPFAAVVVQHDPHLAGRRRPQGKRVSAGVYVISFHGPVYTGYSS